MYNGEDALKLRQCQNWFTKFRSGDFNVKDTPRSGRPIEIDDDKRKALIDSNRRLTTRESAENLNVLKSSVENHLKRPFKTTLVSSIFGYHMSSKKFISLSVLTSAILF
ncbi:Histone-lysine N-methyltransferase SETMAR [Ooceraea biroi]|uniref:Histone-lysine N-methyltransferase SETMAR n=1 Tax=Ooceraea biroi TaxID=2015173 RepID=A0A026W036_OOCBI|nr:Histone-lysine N-methyltransferase SETMAR [Ooceraea biroi]